MAILKTFTLPPSPSALQIPEKKDSPSSFFIAFLASKDPLTNQPWCPDVRAALPILEATFQAEEGEGEQGGEGDEGKKSTPPVVAFIDVGQKVEWKNPHNIFRSKWNIHNVPVLVRYELVGGVTVEGNTTTTKEVKEVGRLVEGEILDERRLQELVYG